MLRSQNLRRSHAIAMALLLAFASIVPLLSTQKADAYGLITSRQITTSSSAGAATDVTYAVSFALPTGASTTVGGLVVDFCQETPIIGDSTCSTPTGFNTNNGTSALANQAGATGWTKLTTGNADANTIVLTRTPSSIGSGTTISFDIGTVAASDGITNPTANNASYYARILVYTTNAGATSYTSAAPGAEPPLAHAGGIALSTAAQINVTAKVQERLTFCVYTTGTGNNCTAKSGTQINLGDANGVLDPSKPYLDKNAKYSVTTNASGNVIVRMKGDTLTSGANTITANQTPATSALGTEQFGLCNYESAGTGLTTDVVYDGGVGTECSSTVANSGTAGAATTTADYAFYTNSSDGTGSTYGDTISTKAAGDYSTAILAMIGNISNTTEAGIYTTVLTFIATGTY